MILNEKLHNRDTSYGISFLKQEVHVNLETCANQMRKLSFFFSLFLNAGTSFQPTTRDLADLNQERDFLQTTLLQSINFALN